MKKYTKVCKQCGITFGCEHGNIKYCSDGCRREHYLAYMHEYNATYSNPPIGIVHGTCIVCGKAFDGKVGRKYCSKRCADAYNWYRYCMRNGLNYRGNIQQ